MPTFNVSYVENDDVYEVLGVDADTVPNAVYEVANAYCNADITRVTQVQNAAYLAPVDEIVDNENS